MRGVIVVDVDDVVVDFVPGLLEHVKKYFPEIAGRHREKTGLELTHGAFHTYRLAAVTGCSREDEIRAVNSFYGTDSFRNLPLIPGAREVLQELKGRDYALIVGTSRPESLRGTTESLFARELPGVVREFHFTSGQPVSSNGTKTKGALCYEKSAVYLIDDSTNHIECCLANGNGTRPILFDAPWNRDCSHVGVFRATGWYDILERIKEAA